MSEEKKRRKVRRDEKKRRSRAAARRRAEGKSRRDVSVVEGSSNGACIHRAASPSTLGNRQGSDRQDGKH